MRHANLACFSQITRCETRFCDQATTLLLVATGVTVVTTMATMPTEETTIRATPVVTVGLPKGTTATVALEAMPLVVSHCFSSSTASLSPVPDVLKDLLRSENLEIPSFVSTPSASSQTSFTICSILLLTLQPTPSMTEEPRPARLPVHYCYIFLLQYLATR